MAYKYMHLIDGEPANYVKNQQIVRVNNSKRKPIRLVESLEQVRREQQASDRWRNDQGFSVDSSIYSYAKVLVD